MDVDGFKAMYPEFTDAGDPLIALYLTDAASGVNPAFADVNLVDRATGIMCARMLAQTPFGQNARMLSKTGRSTYDDAWDNLAYAFNAGGTVL